MCLPWQNFSICRLNQLNREHIATNVWCFLCLICVNSSHEQSTFIGKFTFVYKLWVCLWMNSWKQKYYMHYIQLKSYDLDHVNCVILTQCVRKIISNSLLTSRIYFRSSAYCKYSIQNQFFIHLIQLKNTRTYNIYYIPTYRL